MRTYVVSQWRLHARRLVAGIAAAFCLVTPRAPAWASEPSPAAIDAAAAANAAGRPGSGLSVAVVHRGRLTFVKGYGARDAGSPDTFLPGDNNYYGMPVDRTPRVRRPADGRTIYALGSVTKQFTSAAILVLAERKRLRLDDPIGMYAPEYTDRTLTLRTLLNQRSGIPDLNTLAFLSRVRPAARRPDGTIDSGQVSRELARLPRDFASGARFAYSNSNYYLLGTIVERVTHQPLATFLAATFFVPLKMTRTALAHVAANDDVAVGYRSDEHNVLRRAYPWDLHWLGGAGAMTSTVEDLARWNAALLAHRVLAPASLAEYWHGLDAGRGQGSYAMGWIEDALGAHRYLWHNGEVGGFHTVNVVFPDDDLAISVLANDQDARPEYLVPRIASLYFPVSGLDRILPHSAVVLVEASLAVALGALAIAVVAVVTLKRLLFFGIIAAVLALLIGFFMPTVVGYAWGGLAALVPVGAYLLAVRLVPRKTPARRDRRPQGR